jgi:hypothetical protein
MNTQTKFTKKNGFTATAYSELCTSYKAIDDFRQKLLALLPLVSGASIFLFKEGNNQSTLMAVFGFMVTFGLLIFEVHGIRKCTHLIVLGQFLEKTLEIEGQFRNRPNGLKGISYFKSITPYINEPLAAGIIYPSVLGGWIFLALFHVSHNLAVVTGVVVFCLGFISMWKFNKWLVDKDSDAKMREFEPD